MSIKVYPAFAVPLVEAFHPDQAALNLTIKQLLLSREADGSKYANPLPSLPQHPGVFESAFNLFSWPDSCIQKLREFCWARLGQAVREVNGYSADEIQQISIFSHTWFHITRHGGFTITHAHPMASWSGVYCVDPGETPEDRPESGVLRFHNPHHYSNSFIDQGNLRFQAPYHHGSWSVRFQAGQLVLFPSWMPHEVLPFYGRDERITIAFNCWFGSKK